MEQRIQRESRSLTEHKPERTPRNPLDISSKKTLGKDLGIINFERIDPDRHRCRFMKGPHSDLGSAASYRPGQNVPQTDVVQSLHLLVPV